MTATEPTADLTALLKAIVSHPEADTPRLMYADELDAIAGGLTPRGELIRVQVELARIPVEPKQMPSCRLVGVASKRGESAVHLRRCQWCQFSLAGHIARSADFERREAALTRSHRAKWLPRCPVCTANTPDAIVQYGFIGSERCPCCADTRYAGTLFRGFLHEVAVPRLADVLREVRLHQDDKATTVEYAPTEFARGLFAPGCEWATVQAVVVKDREPEQWRSVGSGGITYSWYCVGFPDDRATIPQVVMVKMEGGISGLGTGSAERRAYPTPEAAKDALARAVADTLRSLCEGRV